MRSALIVTLDDARVSPDELTEILAIVEKAAPADFYLEYEETTLAGKMNQTQSEWDADYFDLQSSYTNTNFSKERVHHLVKVRNYLMEKGVKGFEKVGGK